ncbi:MAG: hypothetical protein EZS28_007772 [Streblomastix strix]|uniref:Uncharacterized protein n=1 Tax=Streblomastix strix TaxID=222440 RepID=A0A5J4WP23_9EUKA|nr:MAG: hypothetical protein EZS28_007772 [Streblomastix strix]
MSFHDGLKVRKGRRFARKILIILNKLKEYLYDTQQFTNKLTKQIYDYNRKQSLDFRHKLPKTRDRTVCPRAQFFDLLKRIDNKHGRSFRDNKYGALWWNEDITIPAKRGQISFRLKKLLDVIGIKRETNKFIQTLSSNITSGNGSRRNVIKHIHRTCKKFKINK